MAAPKPNYTIATLGVPAVVKFQYGETTEYSPVFGVQTKNIAGVQTPQVLVSTAQGLVWVNASACLWETFEQPPA